MTEAEKTCPGCRRQLAARPEEPELLWCPYCGTSLGAALPAAPRTAAPPGATPPDAVHRNAMHRNAMHRDAVPSEAMRRDAMARAGASPVDAGESLPAEAQPTFAPAPAPTDAPVRRPARPVAVHPGVMATDPARAAAPAGPAGADAPWPFSAEFMQQYEAVRPLGSGAMGAVYLMRQVDLDRLVAVKVVRSEALTSEMSARFLREARVLASVSHPNILAIHAVGTDGTLPYSVCEYVEGETLAARLARQPPLSLGQALRMASQILDGLKVAHRQGIVHRDLKPANIFLTTAGRPKIGDFGLAKSHVMPSGTVVGRIMGTPPYMSPEQCRGASTAAATDLYALGVILYEMVTFRRPFPGPEMLDYLQQHTTREAPPPSTLKPELPAALDQILARALRKDPAERFRNAAEFRRAVQELYRSLPASQGRASTRGEARKSGDGSSPAGMASTPGTPITGPADARAGLVLAGRYQLVRLLGQGAMGQVWLARDQALEDEEVAIKLLPPELWRDHEAQANIKQEARISQRLSHPCIVRLMNLEPGPPPFLVMEFVDGPTLAQLLAERRGGERGPMALVDAWPLVRDVAAALDFAHEQKLIHRDIKPSNILLETSEDGRMHAKLADFGIAAEMTSMRTRQTGAVPAGTLAYMSPEQVACQRLDARSDVYALGATLYQMLTFAPPFAGGDLVWAIRNAPVPEPPGVPAPVVEVLRRALAKEPGDRPATAGALALELQQCFASGTVLPPTLRPESAGAPARPASLSGIAPATTPPSPAPRVQGPQGMIGQGSAQGTLSPGAAGPATLPPAAGAGVAGPGGGVSPSGPAAAHGAPEGQPARAQGGRHIGVWLGVATVVLGLAGAFVLHTTPADPAPERSVSAPPVSELPSSASVPPAADPPAGQPPPLRPGSRLARLMLASPEGPSTAPGVPSPGTPEWLQRVRLLRVVQRQQASGAPASTATGPGLANGIANVAARPRWNAARPGLRPLAEVLRQQRSSTSIYDSLALPSKGSSPAPAAPVPSPEETSAPAASPESSASALALLPPAAPAESAPASPEATAPATPAESAPASPEATAPATPAESAPASPEATAPVPIPAELAAEWPDPVPEPAAYWKGWKQLWAIKVGKSNLDGADVSADEKHLIARSWVEHEVRVYTIADRELVAKHDLGADAQAGQDSNQVFWATPTDLPRVIVGDDKGLRLYCGVTGNRISEFGEAPVRALRWTRDRKLLGVLRQADPAQPANPETTLTFYRVSGDTELERVKTIRYPLRIDNWDLSPGGDAVYILASVDLGSSSLAKLRWKDDGRVWDVNAGAKYAKGLAVSPDGRRVAVGGDRLLVRSTRDPKPVSIQGGFGNNIDTIDWSPARNALAVSSYDGRIRIFTGGAIGAPLTLLKELKHSGNVYTVRFIRDGRALLSWSGDRTVGCWGPPGR